MTKTIIIRTCYVWILVWIGISLLCVLPINYYNSIANSLDENGCRISYINGKTICPDPKGQKSFLDDHILAVYKDTGKVADTLRGMESSEWVHYYAYLSFIPIILTQIIALFMWNFHYKWFTFELKSCWPQAQNTKSENSQL